MQLQNVTVHPVDQYAHIKIQKFKGICKAGMLIIWPSMLKIFQEKGFHPKNKTTNFLLIVSHYTAFLVSACN